MGRYRNHSDNIVVDEEGRCSRCLRLAILGDGLCKVCYDEYQDALDMGKELKPMVFQKRAKRIAWNKGLTKYTDDRIADYAKALEGHNGWNKGLTKHTDERIMEIAKKISKGMKGKGKGRIAWNKGLTKHTNSSLMTVSIKHMGSKSWNKGLTKDTDIRVMNCAIKIKDALQTKKHKGGE